MKRLGLLLLLVAGAGVSISPTPVARGRTDDAVLKLTGAEAAMFNTNHDCEFCHGLHGGDPDKLLNNTNVEALCLSCHGAARPDTTIVWAEVHTNDPTGKSCCVPFRVTCVECHVPHSNPINHRGNENLKLVLDSIVAPRSGTKRAVVFESRGPDFGQPTLYSFCDDDEDNNGVWDQVCDVCHEGEVGRHHWDGTQQHHQNGATCTRCHTHGNSLSP